MADADAVLSTVLSVVLSVLLLLAVAVTAALAHRTVTHWRGEQAGRVYELPVDLRGTLLRAGAAGTAAVVAATLAMALADTVGPGAPTAASGPARDLAAAVRATATAPVPPRSGARATPPPPPARTPEPAPPPPEVRTIGHPAGGTLQVMGDGTRVWLPPLYDSARASDLAYPVIVARVPADGRDTADLYQGFARAALRKKADLFILVSPVDCRHDSASVLAEAARRYRTLPARSARGLLGAGPDAPCAVREALSGRDRFGAAAGVSGTYTGLPTATAAAGTAGTAGTVPVHPPLLLATAAGEPGPRASALRLKRALHPSGDAVRTVSGGSRRRDLYGQVAGYMTEKLDGPTRLPSTSTSTTAHTSTSTTEPTPPHTSAPTTGKGAADS